MSANPLETRIPPTVAKLFGRRRPALNPQKDVFSSASGDHMLSQKLFVDVGVFTFWRKPAFGGENPLDLPLIPPESVLSAFLL
jgi:hypothetical protein